MRITPNIYYEFNEHFVCLFHLHFFMIVVGVEHMHIQLFQKTHNPFFRHFQYYHFHNAVKRCGGNVEASKKLLNAFKSQFSHFILHLFELQIFTSISSVMKSTVTCSSSEHNKKKKWINLITIKWKMRVASFEIVQLNTPVNWLNSNWLCEHADAGEYCGFIIYFFFRIFYTLTLQSFKSDWPHLLIELNIL